jgi:hypothetical protein
LSGVPGNSISTTPRCSKIKPPDFASWKVTRQEMQYFAAGVGRVMTPIEIICGSKGAPALEIVWRNPATVRPNRRYHSFQRASQSAVYVVQELVQDGRFVFWATISDLEVVAGGKAA